MPKSPRGEKRPADAIGLAVMVGKIAKGEIEDEREEVKSAAAQLGSLGGKRRAEIAKLAAMKRWNQE
jgi:hypothetical protein